MLPGKRRSADEARRSLCERVLHDIDSQILTQRGFSSTQANYINKVYRMDYNRQTGALRMLDNMMPDVSVSSVPIADQLLI